MEGDRFLDVLIPVFPVVNADKLLVFMGDVHRFQMAMERAVLLEQEVALAAVDTQCRNPAVVEFFDDSERIFGPAPGFLPKIRVSSASMSRMCSVSKGSRRIATAPECEFTLANISWCFRPIFTAP